MAGESMSESHETVQSPDEGSSSNADLVTARLERLPLARFHPHIASVLSVGTFFDAFDTVMIGVVLVLVSSRCTSGPSKPVCWPAAPRSERSSAPMSVA
jgi:hypothetical protein